MCAGSAGIRHSYAPFDRRRGLRPVEDYPHEVGRMLRNVRPRLRHELRAVPRHPVRAEYHVPAVDDDEPPVRRKRGEISRGENREIEMGREHVVLGPQAQVLRGGLGQRRLELADAHEPRRLDHVLRVHASTPEA